ncbi:MAG: SH3 domain-containing protein [Synergistaceae bacterium]|nr:SH3 domain-containing protein [Synergistaceae bacterium]
MLPERMIFMRRVLAVMLVVCMMVCVMPSAVFAEDEYDPPLIEDFPADGRCLGDYVRYRSGPGTNYKALGRLYKDDEVTVRGSETDAQGNVWYKIDNPSGRKGRVWVAGWYIEPLD